MPKDRRSLARKVKDAIIVHENTPEELERDIRRQARTITRLLHVQINACEKTRTQTEAQMRKCRTESELRRLAKSSTQDTLAIEDLRERIRGASRMTTEAASYRVASATNDLLSLQAELMALVAQEQSPADVMKQQMTMEKNRLRIQVSEDQQKKANSSMFRDDAEVEEMTEEQFRMACDRAGLHASEAFSAGTAAPSGNLRAVGDASAHDEWIRLRVQNLNGGNGF